MLALVKVAPLSGINEPRTSMIDLKGPVHTFTGDHDHLRDARPLFTELVDTLVDIV